MDIIGECGFRLQTGPNLAEICNHPLSSSEI
jgi:hypothetical protein